MKNPSKLRIPLIPLLGVDDNQFMRLNPSRFKTRALLFLSFPVLMGSVGPCKEKETGTAPAVSSADPRYLYVSSGACYGGGVTTSTGVGTVVKFNLATGARTDVVDYIASPGDMPVGIIDYDSDNILVGIENTARRIDIVNKRGLGRSTYLSNATALSAALRSLQATSDGGLVVARSTAIERFNSSTQRIQSGANAYINAPAGACATSTTVMSAALLLDNGKTVFAHAGATPNNKIGIISANGYAAAGDCLSSVAAPNTTSLPTSMLYLPGNILLVAYGSTTNANNAVYAYNVDETTHSISGATIAYNDPSVVNGPSAMAYDSKTGHVYIANATNTFNTIEKFTFSVSTKTLTRVGNQPFVSPRAQTRCISGLRIGL